MLEQLQAEEEEECARRAGGLRCPFDPGKMRSELNNAFSPEPRQPCSYPGKCQNHEICYGSSEIRRDPAGSAVSDR